MIFQETQVTFHFGAKLNNFAMSQLQTTRNEFQFGLTDRSDPVNNLTEFLKKKYHSGAKLSKTKKRNSLTKNFVMNS